ncbi:MAG: cold shock domain-containing protein [Xanthobacteraceae bacterium]
MRNTGQIRFWDAARGFGFLTRHGDQADVFVHSKEFARSRLNSPKVGDHYSFNLKIAGQTVQACDLVKLDCDAAATDAGGASPAAVLGRVAAAGNFSSGGQ